MSAVATGQKPRMKLLEWRSMTRNTLRGFAVLKMPSGMIVRDVAVHQKSGKSWAALPARPQIGQDDKVVRNHAGKAQYSALLGWCNRDLADRFSAAVVQLIRAEHPSDLDGAG